MATQKYICSTSLALTILALLTPFPDVRVAVERAQGEGRLHRSRWPSIPSPSRFFARHSARLPVPGQLRCVTGGMDGCVKFWSDLQATSLQRP